MLLTKWYRLLALLRALEPSSELSKLCKILGFVLYIFSKSCTNLRVMYCYYGHAVMYVRLKPLMSIRVSITTASSIRIDLLT